MWGPIQRMFQSYYDASIHQHSLTNPMGVFDSAISYGEYNRYFLVSDFCRRFEQYVKWEADEEANKAARTALSEASTVIGNKYFFRFKNVPDPMVWTAEKFEKNTLALQRANLSHETQLQELRLAYEAFEKEFYLSKTRKKGEFVLDAAFDDLYSAAVSYRKQELNYIKIKELQTIYDWLFRLDLKKGLCKKKYCDKP